MLEAIGLSDIAENVAFMGIVILRSSSGGYYCEAIEETGNSTGSSDTTRVGRWMSEGEYNKMVETGKVQMSSNGNTTYVANPAAANAYKAAPGGSVYIEFDVPTNSIYPAGNSNWGQISGPGSLMDRLEPKQRITSH